MTALAASSRSFTATAAYLRLEVPRTLRNRRLIVLTIVFPVAFYLLFTRVLTGGAQLDNDARAFLMVSMAGLRGDRGGAIVGGARRDGADQRLDAPVAGHAAAAVWLRDNKLVLPT